MIEGNDEYLRIISGLIKKDWDYEDARIERDNDLSEIEEL